MLEKSLLKIICIFSLICGAILGFLPLIPKFMGFSFSLIMLFTAPFIIFYLYKLKLIKTFETQQCLLIGGISGFFSFIGFTFVYFPVALILNLIFKIDSYIWVKVIFANIGFLIPMVILTALLCGLLNMFSAFISVYLYEYLIPKSGKGREKNGI